MPAGAAWPPGTFPGGFARLGRFPEREVAGVALLGVWLDARACDQQFLFGLVREPSIAREGIDGVEDIAARWIGMAGLDQALDHCDNLGHILGDVGVLVGVAHVHGV